MFDVNIARKIDDGEIKVLAESFLANKTLRNETIASVLMDYIRLRKEYEMQHVAYEEVSAKLESCENGATDDLVDSIRKVLSGVNLPLPDEEIVSEASTPMQKAIFKAFVDIRGHLAVYDGKEK